MSKDQPIQMDHIGGRCVDPKLMRLWRDGHLNKKYWRRVLEGHTITKVLFDGRGISYLVLDNDVHVQLCGHSGRLCVKVEE